MPIFVKLTFPAGRYHATPWGRHVNEGVPEWPPSPWRLLRAIVAVWKRTCRTIPEEQVKRVLTAMVHSPVFHLPPHRVAHTRHAMPMNVMARNYKPSAAERKAGKFQGDPTIVFDTFVSVGRHAPVFVGWLNAELSEDDRSVFAQLLANVSSLGRAEGWVHAELTNEQPSWNCAPAPETDPNPISVFCPDPATAFDDEHYPTLDRKKLQQGKVNPADFLFDCPRWHLCLDTETIHRERWPTVPGARWVNYTRPLEGRAILAKPKPTNRQRPLVARFRLDGPVLPLVTDALYVAEMFRNAVLWHFQRRLHRRKYGNTRKPYQEQFYSQVFSGKDDRGRPLHSHDHAYYLPTAEHDAARIDHLTVYAAQGLGPDEVETLNALRELTWEDRDALRLQLVGLGRPDDFRCPLFGPARVWGSATPFVVTRHVKKNGLKKDPPDCYGITGRPHFAERVLREETERWLTRLQLPAEVPQFACTLLDDIGRHCTFRPVEFRRARRKPWDDGTSRATAAFRLEFSREVAGPLCLGHAAHFGLGLFLPAE